jgi:hypothetical protein
LCVPANSLRLIAIDIDGTLLSPEFKISEPISPLFGAALPRASRSSWSPDAVTLLPCPSPNNWGLISG